MRRRKGGCVLSSVHVFLLPRSSCICLHASSPPPFAHAVFPRCRQGGDLLQQTFDASKTMKIHDAPSVFMGRTGGRYDHYLTGASSSIGNLAKSSPSSQPFASNEPPVQYCGLRTEGAMALAQCKAAVGELGAGSDEACAQARVRLFIAS